ncbi:MAG: NAD-dependent epimerase/dehydratase family protein [Candidatus Woykebacteria bacterium]
MKILVTGAAGFIGTNLGERLLEEENEVVGIDNFITGSRKNAQRLSRHPSFTFLEADISKLDPVKLQNLKGHNFDEIYHLACPTGVPNLGPLAEEMLLASSAGTKNILDVSKESKSRFLFTSSSEIYGDPEVFPQTEGYTGNVDPVGLRSPYEEGKRFAESLAAAYARKYDLDLKITRVFNTYGPFMSEKDLRVIPMFAKQIEEGSPLSVHGDGQQKRTFCYINDLVDGLVLVLRKGKKGEVYNIGSDEEINILDLAKLVAKISGSGIKIEFRDRPEHDHEARLPDLSKIKSLGWSPKINLDEGLSLTLKSLESAKM